MCERGFIPAIRDKLSQYRASETQKNGVAFEFKTLAELYTAAATVESGLASLPGRYQRASGPSRKHGNRGGRARIHNFETADIPSSTINKIEMNTEGHPVNVNKKHPKKNVTTPNASASSSTVAVHNSFRGGRGGHTRGGGGGFRGRGGRFNTPSSSSSSGHSLTTHSQPRAQQADSGSSASTFGGTCFICQRKGHKANACPMKTQINRL